MKPIQKQPLDYLISPIQRFIKQEKSGGLVLGISVVLALLLANSPWSDRYYDILKHHFGFQWDGKSYFNFSIQHWINDGLMSIFFFVVGLELKRELIAGELANPKKALLPVMAAIGGMIVPALIYLSFNWGTDTQSGWGIPMATDIAFALGVLYLLGNKIPVALKVFLTALAIVDDLGAVFVIALFYTSTIAVDQLFIGFGFLAIMFAGNKLGIKNIIFYAVFGIGGVWIAFMLSGVHATIAAVLAAFTLPSKVNIPENQYIESVRNLLLQFKNQDPKDQSPVLTNHQLHLLEEINTYTRSTIPPSQRLEQAMHPWVTFIILPLFALANAGVSFQMDSSQLFSTHVMIGVALGLFVGKVVGVVGFTMLAKKLNIGQYPEGMDFRTLTGLGLLASIGFTMSLFVTSLAFDQELYMRQAKIGIFAASISGGCLGYFILNRKQYVK